MTTLPLSEVMARLSEIADEVATTHERVQVTRDGRDYVVLLAAEDLASIEAARELLSDPVAMARVRSAEQLPEAVAAACVEFLFGALAENPRRVGAALRPPFEGQLRARRGEYRVRYRIDDAAGTISVLDVDHRLGVYRC